LADTRTEVISEVLDWASKSDANGTKIFWLHGHAGAGKTTIATSIACSLDDVSRRWLGASFFFCRDIASRSKPVHVLSSIAFQLSSLHPTIASGICQALVGDLDIGRSALSTQFQKLIQVPLRNANTLGKPIVILLDALDECGTEGERKELLGVILSGLPDLPAPVKFVITSRPDADIRAAFLTMDSWVLQFNLSSLQRDLVDRDIQKFAEFRLKEIAQSHGFPLVTDIWPGRVKRESLIQQASGLFLWMSTACEFIEDDDSDDPEMQLSLILDGVPSSPPLSPWKAIDNLYNQVLQQAASFKASPTRLAEIRDILGAIVVAVNPLSAACLSELLNVQNLATSNAVTHRLRKLHSVLAVPDQDDDAIRIIHPSFAEFLADPLRCTDLRFRLDLTAHHCQLAMGCLDVMLNSLRQDLCRIGIEPKMNRHVPDLDNRIKEFIPEELRYACQFWAIHLCQSPVENGYLYDRVHKFAYDHLIHWLGALSLMCMMDGGILSLELAENWIMVRSHPSIF
jgi:hypothetical protein